MATKRIYYTINYTWLYNDGYPATHHSQTVNSKKATLEAIENIRAWGVAHGRTMTLVTVTPEQ